MAPLRHLVAQEEIGTKIDVRRVSVGVGYAGAAYPPVFRPDSLMFPPLKKTKTCVELL